MKILLTLVLALAFMGGMYLATSIFSNKKPPLSAANIHGIIGLVVLVFLGYSAFQMNEMKLWIALGTLIAASAGGLYLVSNHKKDQLGPKSAVLIHGMFGITGIVLTLISIW